MDGLEIKNGRLINNRPDPVMGICKAAQMRKEMKRAKKVRMIAEGNELANANIVIYKHITGHFEVSKFPEIVKMIRSDIKK